jgi:ATP-dependent exoDNAse (exonuclease V) beta subunit
MTDVADRHAREQSLDTSQSFIVQAPAGSGKTELLTQRFLALLARVEKPEEILAITFTRKAAGEMRDRILTALERAADETPPEQAHEALTWRLARAARNRDDELAWGLLDSPARLKVMTIDSLHAILSRQMPLLSGAGGSLPIAGRPELLYREAARRTLTRAGDGDETGLAARALLAHLDNRFDRAESMLSGLLGRREQWLPRVAGPGRLSRAERRAWLEGSIRRQVEAGMKLARESCPPGVMEALPALAVAAARELEDAGVDSPVIACRGLTAWPAADADALAEWRGLAEILMRRDGKAWRKAVNKNLGFPPGGCRATRDVRALLAGLDPDDRFLEELRDVRNSPDWRYTDRQWALLDRLLTLLPACAAELALVMREQGCADYVAVATAAHQALADGDGPTDLALSLDYRIRHILIDEFQDTSRSQIRLLQELTAGWEEGDGRTLFCVGDPMQSIYGFREAEVGLFLDVRRGGRVNEVPIDSLTLEVNFRSDRGLVDWVNETLATVMPDHEEPRLGAVTYVPAVAFHGQGPGAAVEYHAFEDDDGSAEAHRIRELVDRIAAHEPGASIAVLVRARAHLEKIAPRLKEAGIRFQAVEIEALLERQVIQDLLALTRALCHEADRTAWLSVLRAPWCGLTLAELLAVGTDPQKTIWQQIQAEAGKLETRSRSRLDRLRAALSVALSERGRRPLHRLVEGAWLRLGGPACLTDAAGLDDARSFFRRLREFETAGDIDEVTDLEDLFGDLYAAPDPEASGALQLMTIHKAKGLQFDHVFLPGLQKTSRGGDKQLLHWMDVPREDGFDDLLLSAVEERGADHDPLHLFLKRQEDKKRAFELGRLLYVAVTRARRTVHLFASLTFAGEGETRTPRTPRTGALLNLLWPRCKEWFVAALGTAAGGQGSVAPGPERASPAFPRLADDWLLPDAPAALSIETAPALEFPELPRVEFWWAGRTARAVGTVVHRMLERMADTDPALWSPECLRAQRGLWELLLAEQGLEGEALDRASARVSRALGLIMEDEAGRWILFGDHREARCEHPLAGLVDGAVIHVVIDRSFVTEDGTRWVIDYKTGEHEGADLDAYLDREVDRYRDQVERYATMLTGLAPGNDVRVGLYFPLHGVLRSWTPPSASE